MAGWQPQEYDQSKMKMDADSPERERSPTPPDPLSVPVLAPRMSQVPMNLTHDDPTDGMTLDTASNSRSTTDSVWSFESMRDIHEFIREVGGRRYNAQNPTYFLPAGESPKTGLPSPRPFAWVCRDAPLRACRISLWLVQDPFPDSFRTNC
jgi:hypothetical protein